MYVKEKQDMDDAKKENVAKRKIGDLTSAERRAILDRYVAGYKSVDIRCGGGLTGIRTAKVSVYCYNGETGTMRELAERHGMSVAKATGRVLRGIPLDATMPEPRQYDYKGRKMSASEIVEEVCAKHPELNPNTVLTRVWNGKTDVDRPVRKRSNDYVFVDLDGVMRAASTTDICRYYAKYNGVPYTNRVWSTVRARLWRCFKPGEAFNIRDLFNDETFRHRMGTRVAVMKPTVV